MTAIVAVNGCFEWKATAVLLEHRLHADGANINVVGAISDIGETPADHARRINAELGLTRDGILFAHSHGAEAVSLSQPVRLLILAAPAARDVVRPMAWLGGHALAVPGADHLGRVLHSAVNADLVSSDLPFARLVGASLPCGIVGRTEAARQVAELRRGPSLAELRLETRAEQVVVLLGSDDPAVDSARVAGILSPHINVRVIWVHAGHYPHLRPNLLAEISSQASSRRAADGVEALAGSHPTSAPYNPARHGASSCSPAFSPPTPRFRP